jgi:hypothetical protein
MQNENVVAWVYGGAACTVGFRSACVNWPPLVEALEEAGYAVRVMGVKPKPASPKRQGDTRAETIAEWIFAQRPKEKREKELRDMAEQPRAQLGAFTISEFARAFRKVYRTEPHAPSRAGWPLQPEYEARDKMENPEK